jgi:hypothetical protein
MKSGWIKIFFKRQGYNRRLVWKLKSLKNQTKQWAKQQRLQKLSKLEKLEEDIEAALQGISGGMQRLAEERHLKLLEEERNKLLVAEEELWRQRSRALWIKSGDQNTKFFHQFASYRRNHKHIWEVIDDHGKVHFGQEALKTEATRYFKKFLRSWDTLL